MAQPRLPQLEPIGYRLMPGEDINSLIMPFAALTGQGGTPFNIYAQFLFESASDGLTAAGTTQATALQLSSEINRVTTVAVGSGVMLPASSPGLTVLVINSGANPVQVYGSGTDTIDGVATATGVQQMQGSNCLFVCAASGAWYTNGIGTGYAGSLPTVSYTNNITATAAGTQATAYQLTTAMSRITTVATANDAVKLPVSSGGLQIIVANAATNALNVFPQSGDTINALAANAAFSVAGGKTANFYCIAPGYWHVVLSA